MARTRTVLVRWTGLALVVFVTALQATYWNADTASLGESSTLLIALLFAAVFSVRASLTAEDRSERRFWRLLTLIGALLMAGRVYLAFIPVPEQSMPNLANLCDLAAVAVFLVALATATRLGEVGPAARLHYITDVLAAITATYMVTFVFVLAPLASAFDLTLGERLTMAGYPAAGGLLAIGCLTDFATPSHVRQPWERFLLAGLTLFGLTSVAWPWWAANLSRGGVWWATSLIEVLWVLSVGLIGCAAMFRVTEREAAWLPPDVALRPTVRQHPLREPITWIAITLAASALIVAAITGDDPGRAVVVVCAVLLAMLSSLRVMVTLLQSQQRFRWSDTDVLTGLLTATAFRRLLTEEIRLAERHGDGLCLAVTDVLGMGMVNRVHGSGVGDEVLRSLAHVLREAPTIATCRLGGDAFAFAVGDLAEVVEICDRAAEAIGRAVVSAPVGLSTGVAFFPDHGTESNELLEHAWAATTAAKLGSARSPLVFDPDSDVLEPAEEARVRGRGLAISALRLVAAALDARDPVSREHSGRVAALAVALGGRLGIEGERLRILETASLLHDVGKLASDDVGIDVLTSADPSVLQRHAGESARLLREAGLLRAAECVERHHEPWSASEAGSLALETRIIAACDAFDRYAGHEGDEAAWMGMIRLSGGAIDPAVTAELLLMLAERRAS